VAKKDANELMDEYRRAECRLQPNRRESVDPDNREKYRAEAEQARSRLKAKEREIFGDSTSYATAQIYANDAFKQVFGEAVAHRLNNSA